MERQTQAQASVTLRVNVQPDKSGNMFNRLRSIQLI